ncbi:hypothetical protein LJC61_06085 [Ruminococcaceae bacterium OttesenSCG-928-A16]|nr:hypothetical protein [Ruminococcaceae bacterium OttesenSCG-928-A16]
MNMKTKFNGKKVIIFLSILALLSVLGMGVTLALLSTTTNTAKNHFMVLGSQDISAEVIEPLWTEEVQEAALTMVPDAAVPKDPAVTNTSEAKFDEYAALQIIFTDGKGDALNEEDYARLMDLLEIQYDAETPGTNYNTNWVLQGAAQNGAIYVYNEVLPAGESTEPIFTSVTIKASATISDMDWIRDTLEGFDICIGGAVMQAQGVTLPQAETELTALLSST